MCGVVEIEAIDLADAIAIAESDPNVALPEGDYIDESFKANYEMTEELNK
jgi:hypothetical protein